MVRADDGPVDEGDAPVDLPGGIRRLLDRREDPIPAPGLAPAPDAAGHRRPWPIPLR